MTGCLAPAAWPLAPGAGAVAGPEPDPCLWARPCCNRAACCLSPPEARSSARCGIVVVVRFKFGCCRRCGMSTRLAAPDSTAVQQKRSQLARLLVGLKDSHQSRRQEACMMPNTGSSPILPAATHTRQGREPAQPQQRWGRPSTMVGPDVVPLLEKLDEQAPIVSRDTAVVFGAWPSTAKPLLIASSAIGPGRADPVHHAEEWPGLQGP
jgi:hypothetical protein